MGVEIDTIKYHHFVPTRSVVDAQRVEKKETMFTGYSGRLLIVLSLGWMTLQMGRQLLPPLLPTVIDALAITPVEAGFVLTVVWGVYAFAQYPSGRLSDHLTRKTLLVPGLGLLVLGFAIFGVAPTYPVLLAGAVVIGLGTGLYPTAARALVSDIFVEKRGQAFGVHTAAGDLVGAFAAGVAVAALATWQSAFIPVILLLAVVALHRWDDDPYVIVGADLEGASTVRRLLSNPRTRRLLAAYALFSFTWQGSTGFLPALLQLEKGFDPAVASGGFAALFIVGTIVKPIAGQLGDRFGRGAVSSLALLLGVVGLSVVIAGESVPIVLVSVVSFAAGLMSFPSLMQAHLMDIFPTRSMGGTSGQCRRPPSALEALGRPTSGSSSG